MGLEDYSPEIDSSEWWWQTTEASKEVSEKFKEWVKKWTAWIKRTQKDEKKAKKHDLLLANFLVQIIINKKYDFLLEQLFKCIDVWIPSNFLLWIISLINLEISDKIREISWKEKVNFNYSINKETIEFDDNLLSWDIKKRINFWVEDITDVVSIDYSSLLTKKLLSNISNNWLLIVFTAMVFKFFLKEINIYISDAKSVNISEFILSEVHAHLKKINLEEI